ncbi:MAG: PilZ domain-containing protein [Pseudomonadota bacterium]
MSEHLNNLAVPLLLPMQWQESSAPVDEAAALRALQTAATLGEKPPPVSEDALGPDLEVNRLHQKTQLLIELLAVALRRNAVTPLPQLITLSATHCQWQHPVALPAAAQGVVSLWLHPASPEPLQWPAEIIGSSSQGAGWSVEARLLPLGDAAQAALDRHVFLLHRRAVAEARAQRQ